MNSGSVVTGSRPDALRLAWSEGAEPITDTGVLAPLFGADFRINLKKALSALWHTAQAVLGAAKLTASATLDPVEAMGVAADSFAAITGFAETVRRRLHPLAYMTALALSGTPEGIERVRLQAIVNDFIRDAGAAADAGAMPWYLGLRPKLIAQARDGMKQGGGFEATIERLISDGIVEMDGSILKYRDRIWEWRCVAKE